MVIQWCEEILSSFQCHCFGLYVFGISWYIALSHEDVNRATYVDENALLPGLVKSHFGWKGESNANKINEYLSNLPISEQTAEIENYLLRYDIQSNIQYFTYKSPFPTLKEGKLHYETYNSTNFFAIVRAGRTASTECIILNIPYMEDEYNYGIGVAIALAWQIRVQPYWAKDIILLFTSKKKIGVQAWLESYHSTQGSKYITHGPLYERAGNIQAAFVLELKAPRVSHLNIELVGNDGQLPNCDLLNVVAQIFYTNRIPVSLNDQFDHFHAKSLNGFLHCLHSTYQMMTRLAIGYSDRNHAVFLQHDVEALTIEGTNEEKRSSYAVDYERVGVLIEGIFRSINNLLENLHHSFYFYILPSTHRYISIGMYMPPFGLIMLGPLIKALLLYLDLVDDKEDSPEKEEETIDDILKEIAPEVLKNDNTENNSPSWMETLNIMGLSYFYGVLLCVCPFYSDVWALMFNMEIENASVLIFFSCYVVGATHLVMYVIKSEMSIFSIKLCHFATLILQVVTIAAVALMNFSTGMFIAVLMVPFTVFTDISLHRKKILYIALTFIASPLVVGTGVVVINKLLLNRNTTVDLMQFMQTALQDFQLHSLISGSWIFAFLCICVYSNWLMHFVIAIAIPKSS